MQSTGKTNGANNISKTQLVGPLNLGQLAKEPVAAAIRVCASLQNRERTKLFLKKTGLALASFSYIDEVMSVKQSRLLSHLQ